MYPKQVTSISINVDKDSGIVTIDNNGPLGGLVIQKPKKKMWNPELVFGHLLTVPTTTIHKSALWEAGTDMEPSWPISTVSGSQSHRDPETKQEYSQEWFDNMSTCYPPKMKKFNGATVRRSFKPDWSRFGMKDMENGIYKIMEKRVWDANICTSANCKVKFNGEALPKQNFEATKMHEELGHLLRHD